MRKEVQLELEDGCSQSIEVEIIGSGRLRLLESPVFTDGDLRLGTVVDVIQTPEGDYRVRNIVSQSNYRFETAIIGPTSDATRARMWSFCERHGVVLEMFAEGMLYLNIPPNTGDDFLEALLAICDEGA